jgi:para-aminobenzoate synthetase/4-amino-4-deoxychorismate lyase
LTHASAAQPVRAFIDFPPDQATGQRLRARFESPLALLTAWLPEQVLPLLTELEKHAAQGHWCLGALAYEAASAFDAKLISHPARAGWPLAQFAVFDTALPWPAGDASRQSADAGINPSWQFSMTELEYASKVESARQAMAAGDCYQINLTGRLEADFSGDIAGWMARLQAAQPDGYALWLDWGNRQFLSASPELFFDWRPEGASSADKTGAGKLSCKPMKGTAPRNADPVQDAAAKQTLADSDKERAENVMIVDLLRSDMGRIAVAGSVQVEQLFEIQALPTVWQMTSTITARTRPATTLVDIFSALFPCGSITGAPKASAMQWITKLEDGARGVYCGAAGVIKPGGAATFNVPIRSLMLEKNPHQLQSEKNSPEKNTASTAWQAVYGVGSGITFYANAKDEWIELAHKSRLLERSTQAFDLLETIRLEDGNYWLLELHLARMAQSANYFGYRWDALEVTAALQALAQNHSAGCWRVRLCTSRSGAISLAAFALEVTPEPVLFKINLDALDTRSSNAEFVQHKTTRRQHYDQRLLPDCFDTLLLNERGEFTEFTRGCLALRINGEWLTPALQSGLLPSTYRTFLIAEKRISQAVLTPADLERADGVAFFNSVRGWLAAKECTQHLA